MASVVLLLAPVPGIIPPILPRACCVPRAAVSAARASRVAMNKEEELRECLYNNAGDPVASRQCFSEVTVDELLEEKEEPLLTNPERASLTALDECLLGASSASEIARCVSTTREQDEVVQKRAE